MNKIIIELQYLPPIEYFVWLTNSEVCIEQHETYQKQTYRNRCQILGANKVETLVIPIKHSADSCLIKKTQIDNTQNWQKSHWRTLSSAYGKSPYFEYYADYLSVAYQKKYELLWDLNWEILSICLKLLKIKPEIGFSTQFEKTYHNDIIDLRGHISCKTENRPYPIFVMPNYQQVFGIKFACNLSIIDLICCEGPHAADYLQSIKCEM